MPIKNYDKDGRKKTNMILKIIFLLLRSTLNLFSCTTDKYVLLNIKTGRQISKSVESYLLNVIEIGEENRDAFVDEC